MVKTLKLQSSLLIFLFKWFFNCFERKSTSLILRREIETTLCQALPSHHLHKLTTLASWSQAFTHSQPPKKLKFAISWSTQPPSNLPLNFFETCRSPNNPFNLPSLHHCARNQLLKNKQPTLNLQGPKSKFTCMFFCKEKIFNKVTTNI
jgi:hypothetical protein